MASSLAPTNDCPTVPARRRLVSSPRAERRRNSLASAETSARDPANRHCDFAQVVPPAGIFRRLGETF
jgi:hypothetical protein